jgi:aspartyl-tRNA(Asn)/glutamyl-tRNA(Gln) amidotransferase subunit A
MPPMGRLRGIFDDRADPVMRSALDEAVDAMTAAGARVFEQPLPDDFDEVHHHHRVIMASEAAAWHKTRFAEQPEEYQPRIAELITEGLSIPATEYILATRHQRESHWWWGTLRYRESSQEVSTLITPAAIGPAPDTSTTGDPVFNSPWTYAGMPTISLPIGLAPDGLPLAMQLIGCRDETDLFSAALWCEAVIRRAHRARAVSFSDFAGGTGPHPGPLPEGEGGNPVPSPPGRGLG